MLLFFINLWEWKDYEKDCIFNISIDLWLDKPETVEGSENYDFYVKGENAFTYEIRGSEAYIFIDGNYYKVSNPSTPPID